jgi:orotate phosphoribosyltransferase
VRTNPSTSSDWILKKFKASDALLTGHFVLSSGLHSPKYLQCALALQRPSDAEIFAQAIALKCRGVVVDSVASPAIGGLVAGYATAQAMGTRFIWTERQNGAMALRRGFTVSKSERILVVEDVITTGGSTRECIAVLEENGARVVGAASIVDRSGGKADVGIPRVSLLELDVTTYTPDACPLCAAGIEVVKPGSRTPTEPA